MSDWKTLYEAAQRQRLHWSSMITTILGFLISANVLVWIYALSNYLPSLAGYPIIQQPIYVFVAAMASSISLGLWTIYTHYLDSCITRLYPEIIYYEAELGVIEGRGLRGYLENELHIEKIFGINMTNNEISEVLNILIKRKLIGDRKHKWFDTIAIIFIIFLFILCFIAESLTRECFKGTYGWVHIACMVPMLISLAICIFELCVSPKNPTNNDINDVINKVKQPKPETIEKPIDNRDETSGNLDAKNIKIQLDRIELTCADIREKVNEEKRSSSFIFLFTLGVTFIMATLGILGISGTQELKNYTALMWILLFGGIMVLGWAALSLRQYHRKRIASIGTYLMVAGVFIMVIIIYFNINSIPILVGIGELLILAGLIMMDIALWSRPRVPRNT